MKNRSLRLFQAFIFALSTVVIPAKLTWGQQVPGYPGLPSPTGQPIGQPIEQQFNLGFGNDDRIPMYSTAYPWSAIGRVQNDGGHCTGSLIGENLVLTNAHCIFNNNGQLVGANFAPNYKQGSAPETVRGIEYWWGTSNPNNERRYDWAIIKLERPIGKQYGWFGWRSLNYNQLRNRKVIYAGYTAFGDEPRKEEFEDGKTAQVHIDCTVRDINPNSGWINTDCDNGTGGSGGPVFIFENGKPYIVAINAADHRINASARSYFTRDYTPGFGNVAVPTPTFAHALRPSSGYYRLGNQPAVHYVNTNNRIYCNVQSPHPNEYLWWFSTSAGC